MSDPDKTTCEVCGGALDRLISRTAFSLKGSGWYKDLYASPKPEAASGDKGDKAADKPSGDAAPAATADKPAAKSDAGSGGGSAAGGGSSGGGASGGSGGGSSGGGGSGGSSGGGGGAASGGGGAAGGSSGGGGSGGGGSAPKVS
jgi:hypothetical protein